MFQDDFGAVGTAELHRRREKVLIVVNGFYPERALNELQETDGLCDHVIKRTPTAACLLQT